MSKRSKACEFSLEARREIYERDKGLCIFCQSGILGPRNWMESQINGVMHFIPRSQGGLGIPENGALGCNYHHFMLDNGVDDEMRVLLRETFERYLKAHYPGWNKEELYYDKYR